MARKVIPFPTQRVQVKADIDTDLNVLLLIYFLIELFVCGFLIGRWAGRR